MELQLNHISGFRLIGLKLEHKSSNENSQAAIDCGMLWQQFQSEKWLERISGKIEDSVYAVYYEFEGDHTKPFSFFIGCKVDEETPIIDGMHEIHIPSNSYAKYIAKGKMPNCIAEAWQNIWQTASNRAYQFDFEVYGIESWDWNDAKVEIFISSNKNSK